MRANYLEIVTREVDAVCATYEAGNSARFWAPVAELDNAQAAEMPDGRFVGAALLCQ